MADLSITISNNLIVVGYNPTSQWGTLEWGTDWWRFNGETLQDVGKAIDFGSTTLSDAPIKDVEHLLDFGSTLLSDTITKSFERSYNNSLLPTFEMSEEYLQDEDGYFYVFPGGVTDADERVDSTWSDETDPTSTWSAVTSATAPWS